MEDAAAGIALPSSHPQSSIFDFLPRLAQQECQMDCPKCGAHMELIDYRGVEIDRCTACGGIWLDAVEPEQLRAMPGAESIDTGSELRGAVMNDKEEVDCPR